MNENDPEYKRGLEACYSSMQLIQGAGADKAAVRRALDAHKERARNVGGGQFALGWLAGEVQHYNWMTQVRAAVQR